MMTEEMRSSLASEFKMKNDELIEYYCRIEQKFLDSLNSTRKIDREGVMFRVLTHMVEHIKDKLESLNLIQTLPLEVVDPLMVHSVIPKIRHTRQIENLDLSFLEEQNLFNELFIDEFVNAIQSIRMIPKS
ncbi:hypothetical protein SFC65_19355 [Priestia filamentosa]|uniref:hypothetical protein n=1 Tax=Priestia filamentosa TaxID=1402861 RepID=UPI003982B9B4